MIRENVHGFIGTWVLRPEKSRYELGQPPQTGSYTIEEDGDGLTITMDWVAADGKAYHQVYRGIPDGKSYPYDENPAVDAFSMTAVDARTLDTEATKDAQVVSYARRVLSEDGQIMTVTMSGNTPQGTAYTNLAIYERQPAPENA
jgi:hypothetical protein